MGDRHREKHALVHNREGKFWDLAQRKYRDKEVDICIVGAGAAGGVLAQELSKAGMEVVVIEAGPFWDPLGDFASDELAAQGLAWNDTRLVEGKDPLKFGPNNSGRGVGGGTVHFTGVFYRLHESDFKVKTTDGVGEDWPISYKDLEPYYEKVEREVRVSGPKVFPWGNFSGPYPFPERDPISANAQVFRRGCKALGIRSVVPPLAILSAPYAGRPPCINRGFCNQGCMPYAKFSTLIQHIPKAIECGAEIITDSMVTQILVSSGGDRVTGVEFVNNGKTFRQRAKVVVLSSFVVETPRLLLNCKSTYHPQGLANSSGMVGKAIMPHSGHDVFAKFDEEIRPYKGTPVLATSQDFYSSHPSRGFVRGYTLQAHGHRPVSLAKGLAVELGYWGKKLRRIMMDFNYYAHITLVGEVLPDPNNCLTLSEEKDEYGLYRPLISFSYGDNDKKLYQDGIKKAREILEAAGGTWAFTLPDTAHLMGGTPMGRDPSTSVVNGFCQSHDIPNLYICSSSVFVTSGGANPTETVMAIAYRTADHLIDQGKKAGLGSLAHAR